MRGWWREISGLVLPVSCGGCGRPRVELCPECRAELYGGVPRRVSPVPEPAGLPVVHAAAAYENAVRAVLLGHKERGELGLAGALGTALAGAVRTGAVRAGAVAGSLLLVPVPSARRAVAARGHDPTRRIALAAARELRRDGVRAQVVPVLRQRREVADQAGLDARRRQTNLAGALEVVAGGERLLTAGRVVLVDDLLTTGASLAEAARAVREARDVPPGAGEARGARGPLGSVRDRGGQAAVVAVSPSAFEINRNSR
ncbi:ComF family protein [Streptomyces sp. NPDC058195]|uniref:ComF family protein n=1 Tax=Streptomyces sp. NPDC058195 TaxID=3346375 RepID=UPI0036E2EEE9